MDTISLLEKLAQNTHHNLISKELVELLPKIIKTAWLSNNNEMLKKQISTIDYYSNESHVICPRLPQT